MKRYEMQESKSMKLDGKLKIPLSIDFSPYKQSMYQLPTNHYDLYGVINHTGSLDTGHYTVYIKYRDEWYLFDDQAVYQVKEDKVLYGDAYMVFYAQRMD